MRTTATDDPRVEALRAPLYRVAQDRPVSDQQLLEHGSEPLRRAALGHLQSLVATARQPEFDRVLTRAMQLIDGDVDLEAIAIFRAHFDERADAQQLSQRYRAWAARHARPARTLPLRSRSPSDPIHVAYVADYLHMMFLHPVLQHHDADRFRVFLYTNDERFDLTRYPALTVVRLDDVDLPDACRAHRIDLALDLCGPVPWRQGMRQFEGFQQRLAPIQCSWIATINTSGSPAMDVVLADRTLIPEGAEALYSERVVRLPEVCHAWAPPAHCPIGPLPARRRGYVTFGSANRGFKLHDALLGQWASITAQTPDARFHFKGFHCQDPQFRQRAGRIFAAHGVEAQRLTFSGFTAPPTFFHYYNNIDISLDTHPYGGGITSLESLWMGVPPVTLSGTLFVSRVTASYLRCLQLDALICTTPREYIDTATALARDLDRLGALRRSLRKRLTGSPICDAPAFVRQLESLYRELVDGPT